MKKTLIAVTLISVALLILGIVVVKIQQEPLSTQSEVSEISGRPVLQGIGVNVPDDFLFSEDVLFNDGYIKNEKLFLEFGDSEYLRGSQNIEYWYFLKPKTKIRSVIGGTVSLFFIERTKDWGVSVHQENSEYIVSFEHLTNLKVKEGDVVKPGDILGEAVPWSANSNVGFTEFSVWTGGENIFKYCPFDFLDESIQSVYKQKINKLVSDWEKFTGEDVYRQEDWVSPGCLVDMIQER